MRDYAIVTGTYWAFTLTDGALRMLVLLHLHQLGYAPLEIASLFLFYELFGVVTNFVGGWLGARFGLKSILVVGVALQVAACGGLAAFAGALSLPVVLVAQALSGTAKDLVKTSSKSYVKLVVPPGDARRLLRWVSVLTGSKNSLKGAGFFLGGAALGAFGFRDTCAGMAGGLVLALLLAAATLPRAAGRMKQRPGLSQLIARDARVNWLAAARFFLFGARDVWFVLALPVFLASQLGWSHGEVGGFLAAWVIGYGFVQASAPAWVGGRGAVAGSPGAGSLLAWTTALLAPVGVLLVGLAAGWAVVPTLVAGLAAFASVFAANSALHSFLIVHYAEGEKVALNVGFYYSSNAAGRLVGTLLSGGLYQAAGEGLGGLQACLLGSLLFVAASAALCIPLRAAEGRRLAAPTAPK